ncbi:LPXTG-motif cell wall-anchored protein [Streptacidiphilus sp. MAP12-20]|uniref:LPXTG cell wall anchor domain-containing protein n=1 Tax=Streptacidiphilus sp. MAP12-20 TaxID=3156299 RepID=UPI0035165E42
MPDRFAPGKHGVLPVHAFRGGSNGGTTGGGLAHTGGGDDTSLLLGAGAGVLALGAGLVALTRRKRQPSTNR